MSNFRNTCLYLQNAFGIIQMFDQSNTICICWVQIQNKIFRYTTIKENLTIEFNVSCKRLVEIEFNKYMDGQSNSHQ